MRALLALGGHIPSFTAIAALGVGFELAFHHVEDEALFRQGRWILCGAAGLYLAGVTLDVHRRRPQPACARRAPRAARDRSRRGCLATSFPSSAIAMLVAVALVTELLYKGRLYGWTGEDAEEDTGGQ